MAGKTEYNVIAFSLYGNANKYCIGALENAALQKGVYPDWTCRFYVDKATVPQHIISKLHEYNSEIVFCKNQYYGKFPEAMFWRFSIMADSSVDRFIVRDTDSRLNIREKYCVDEWIQSNKALHIIRDHKHHNHRIMGGMWGSVNKYTMQIPYNKLYNSFISKHKDWPKLKMLDQKFLAEVIYPRLKDNICVHDNRHFYKDEVVRHIPDFEGVNFIGEIIDVK